MPYRVLEYAAATHYFVWVLEEGGGGGVFGIGKLMPFTGWAGAIHIAQNCILFLLLGRQ